MKSTTTAIALVLATSFGSIAFAGEEEGEDRGYRYDSASGGCQNDEGQQGYNPGYVGECGDLTEHRFEDKSLKGANFRGALLKKVKFSGFDLSEADFEGANLERANFFNANVAYADFNCANLERANFSNAIAQNANFQEADLFRSVFFGADARGSRFWGSDMRESDLRNSNFFYTDLFYINVYGSIFSRFTWLPFSYQDAIAKGMIPVGP